MGCTCSSDDNDSNVDDKDNEKDDVNVQSPSKREESPRNDIKAESEQLRLETSPSREVDLDDNTLQETLQEINLTVPLDDGKNFPNFYDGNMMDLEASASEKLPVTEYQRRSTIKRQQRLSLMGGPSPKQVTYEPQKAEASAKKHPKKKSKDRKFKRKQKKHGKHGEGLDDPSVRNNMRQSFKAGAGMTTTFANMLAMTALDLTAPASDAILKNRKNAWIQLAGHPGAFAPAGPSTIWKRRMTKESSETKAYKHLMDDIGKAVVPEFHREVEYNGEFFIEMEDLLQHFKDPNIMDLKMGTRTFLESEVKNPVLRKDLYEKMIRVDPLSPTDDEHEQKSITKLRYMQFRENASSTTALGFRMEAIRITGEPPNTNLKSIHTKQQVSQMISKFLKRRKNVRHPITERLKHIRRTFEISPFFMSHEIIGGSILIMYDADGNSGAWMIDFANTNEERRQLSHRAPWKVGNHEDGYLYGLDHLIELFENLDLTINGESPSSPQDVDITVVTDTDNDTETPVT